MWTIEYDNDTGPGDESFTEWWLVTNGTDSLKTDNRELAVRVCALLNQTP